MWNEETTWHTQITRMTIVFLVVVQKVTSVPTCPSDSPLECTSGLECYSFEQRCDGYEKCSDGSDEKDCHLNETMCALRQQVFCSTTHACVATWWDCDFNCPDDHPNRCEKNSECFADDQRCNQYFDCLDESDEANCTWNSNGLSLGWNADDSTINLPALFTILGPVMAGAAVLLFVCKLRASLRAGARTTLEGRLSRPRPSPNIEPVFYTSGDFVATISLDAPTESTDL